MKRSALILAAILAIAAPVAAQTPPTPGGPPPQLVLKEVLGLSEGQVATLRDVVSSTGLVEPREVMYVSSEMPGTVTRLVARANDVVSIHGDFKRRQLRVAADPVGNHLIDGLAGPHIAAFGLLRVLAAHEPRCRAWMQARCARISG